MTDSALALLDEFAAAWARGETPDPRELLARAPEDEREELTQALDRYLVAAPARAPSAASRAYVAQIAGEAAADAEPPLLAARLQRRLTRDAVVDKLMGLLGLDPGKRSKVRTYFSDLEVGVLNPRGVNRAVWDALGQVLGEGVVTRSLRGGASAAPAVEIAYYRVPRPPELAGAGAPIPAPARDPAGEPDEVDRLFTGERL